MAKLTLDDLLAAAHLVKSHAGVQGLILQAVANRHDSRMANAGTIIGSDNFIYTRACRDILTDLEALLIEMKDAPVFRKDQ